MNHNKYKLILRINFSRNWWKWKLHIPPHQIDQMPFHLPIKKNKMDRKFSWIILKSFSSTETLIAASQKGLTFPLLQQQKKLFPLPVSLPKLNCNVRHVRKNFRNSICTDNIIGLNYTMIKRKFVLTCLKRYRMR